MRGGTNVPGILFKHFRRHTEDTSNPHKVDKKQLGLENVQNVAPNDQTPTYTQASTLTNLVSGEKLSISMGKISKAIADLIAHLANKNNPHAVTKTQVGLGNVDNTSDTNKPVSAAQSTAIADAKKAGTEAQDNLNSHTKNKNNPHGVDKTQVGLGNVPNVSTNDQTPTYSQATSLANLTSGEKLSLSLGKIMKAIADLIAHLANKNNPHAVTKTQVGLGNVDNKSSETIRNEITKENVTKALGYTPPETAGNNYTHPTYTARTGVPTADEAPGFGGFFNVTQPISDGTGHITGMNNRKITFPNAIATAAAAGLMSPSLFNKLAGIAENATKVIVDAELSADSENAIQNKVVKAILDSKTETGVLWENLDPDAEFPPQDITIPGLADQSVWEYILISSQRASLFCKNKQCSANLGFYGVEKGAPYFYNRTIYVTSDGIAQMGDNYHITFDSSGATAEVNNRMNRPLVIVGIRGVKA